MICLRSGRYLEVEARTGAVLKAPRGGKTKWGQTHPHLLSALADAQEGLQVGSNILARIRRRKWQALDEVGGEHVATYPLAWHVYHHAAKRQTKHPLCPGI